MQKALSVAKAAWGHAVTFVAAHPKVSLVLFAALEVVTLGFAIKV